MSFTLDLYEVSQCNPCSTEAFTKKSGGSPTISYPNGFETARVALENPVALLWLVAKKLVPVTFTEASQAIEKAHGPGAAKKLREDFAKAARPATPGP